MATTSAAAPVPEPPLLGAPAAVARMVRHAVASGGELVPALDDLAASVASAAPDTARFDEELRSSFELLELAGVSQHEAASAVRDALRDQLRGEPAGRRVVAARSTHKGRPSAPTSAFTPTAPVYSPSHCSAHPAAAARRPRGAAA